MDDWLKENVISNLRFTDKITASVGGWENKDMSEFECVGQTPMIKNRLEKWLSQFEEVEMWSDCLSYVPDQLIIYYIELVWKLKILQKYILEIVKLI